MATRMTLTAIDGVYGDVAQNVGGHLGRDRTQRADNAEEEYNRLDGDCSPYRFCLSALVKRLFTSAPS